MALRAACSGLANTRQHKEARCTNCGGAHGARADVCAAKREARQIARGWRTLPPPRRERGPGAPEAPEDETPIAQEGEETGETEAEEGFDPAPEGRGVGG